MADDCHSLLLTMQMFFHPLFAIRMICCYRWQTNKLHRSNESERPLIHINVETGQPASSEKERGACVPPVIIVIMNTTRNIIQLALVALVAIPAIP